MIYTNEDGFKIFDGAEWGPFLIIETRRINECLNYLNKTGITRIHLNKQYGYEAKNLGVLSSLEFIDGLTAPIDLDFSELRKLRSLKVLGLRDNGRDVIDLSWFPDLEDCSVTYSKRLRGLTNCSRLRELTLANYGSRNKDLSEFPRLSSLEKLVLIKSSIESLSGLGKLAALRHFEAYLMCKLTSLAGLTEARDSLEVIILDHCRRLMNHEDLGQLYQLQKLILGGCGKIQSIRFLESLQSLHFFSFVDTNVLDGDLRPCIEHGNLSYVGFDDKRHYSHKLAEIRRVIESHDTNTN